MMVETLPLAEQARLLAEHGLVTRLLNCYLRERQLQESVGPHAAPGQLVRLPLRDGDRWIQAELRAYSPIGCHQWGPRLWLGGHGAPKPRPIGSALELGRLIVAGLAAGTGDATRWEAQRQLLEAMENSLANTARYSAHALQRGAQPLAFDAPEATILAEQRLACGHPFHPTPKSAAGFTQEEQARYAPELGASFQLHVLAADPELVEEAWLPGAPETLLSPATEQAARALLPSSKAAWPLLPCHPWQAAYLRQLPAAQALLEQDLLADLGPLGEPAYPTSSVRTVWSSGERCYLKLPLNVRITNFIRNNPPDQLRRSLDVSRVLAELPPPSPRCTILVERGYRMLAPAGLPDAERAALMAATGVLWRQGPPPASAAPLVLAALLEPCPTTLEPPLLQALRLAERGPFVSAETACRWLGRYLEVVLAPVLDYFLHYGVSLEAHVQNTLLALEGGWPAHAYLRDLEGVSISRPMAERATWGEGLLTADSPALYPEAQAWQRWQYYVVVNQLGHVVSTLGHHTRAGEQQLWHTLRSWLLQRRARSATPRGQGYLDALLEASTLPAKANLISVFQQRAETPDYVPIWNPLSTKEVA